MFILADWQGIPSFSKWKSANEMFEYEKRKIKVKNDNKNQFQIFFYFRP